MIGQTVSSYRILRKLGRGGMGVVYEAEDLVLGRHVALKFLPDDISDHSALERFRREARAASSLNHAHICTIHAVDQHAGRPFMVMELMEGATVRELLAAGPLPLAQAVSIAAQVADALHAAHARGMVHRDLKPANVFVTNEGQAKLLDFGLAQWRESVPMPVGTAAAAAGEHLTATGAAVGTVPYMSPEQVVGDGLDARSDLFSLGVLLYEMTTGSRPFEDATDARTLEAIVGRAPVPVEARNPELPAALAAIVAKLLEKDRQQRYQDAAEVHRDLVHLLRDLPVPSVALPVAVAWPISGAPRRRRAMRVLSAILAVTVALAAGWALLRPRPRPDLAPRTIAVLPFEPQGPAVDEYFADGVADDIRGKLATLSGLRVIARGSSVPYRGTSKTPQRIAGELGAGYLLTATVRWEKATGRVHVRPELVEIAEGSAPVTRWQERFDVSPDDIFQVQSDIATRVVGALDVALGQDEAQRLARRPTRNLRAWDAYARGEAISKGVTANDPPTLLKAIPAYEEAVSLDPSFMEAWAHLSRLESVLYFNGQPTPAGIQRSREAAERALKLAPDRSDGYVAMGQYQAITGEPEKSLGTLLQALRLAPNDAIVLSRVASAEWALGHTETALDHLRQAAHLDPRSISAQRILGYSLMRLRRFDEAITVFDRALRLDPGDFGSILYRISAELGRGDLAAGRAILAERSRGIDAGRLIAFVSRSNDLVWVLDEKQRALLPRLGADAYGGDEGGRALVLAQASALDGDAAGVRAHAQAAHLAYEEQLKNVPDNAQVHALNGVSLAYLGRKAEAVREGERAVRLSPLTRDNRVGPYMTHQLARIYILVGEHDKAVALLGQLMKVPYFLSPGWLRIDPNFDPLRSHPGFQKLAGTT